MPERRNLADVRKGEFELLVQEIDQPARKPDFGRRAGRQECGDRRRSPVLIAYNFYLHSADVAIAKDIAKRIRFSSGGLPGVKALGLLVEGQAQVSVNLVDHTQTPLHTLMDKIMELRNTERR